MKTQLKVYCGNGMSASLNVLIPLFEKEHQCQLQMLFNPAQVVLRDMQAGQMADMAILGSTGIDQAITLGFLEGQTRQALTRNGIGVGILAGSPKPDLSSVEAFKQILTTASSICYTTDGASGIYFAQLIEKLGLKELVQAKAKTRSGGLIAELVVSGEAQIAVQQVPEILAVKGIDYAGPLPAEIQNIATTTAALFKQTKMATLAQQFIHFLRSTEAKEVFKARGLDPL